MLVIISDLHLTDGPPRAIISQDAFKIFRERLRDLAYAASVRKGETERYEPVSEIHLLLAGDILDVIRSPQWLDSEVRPWDDPKSLAFVQKIREITQGILNLNYKSLQIIQNINKLGVNISKFHGGDPGAEPTVTVPVRTYYMVGNHDWFYHLPGAEYDAIRASIIDAFGLANDRSAAFPHDPAESPAVQQLCREHHVLVRHGDIYDSNNYEAPDRNRSSLGDAIVIELVGRFSHEVEKQLSGRISPRCLEGLQEIDNVRPLDLIPAWVDGLLRRTCKREEADQVRHVWNQVADDFLNIPFVRARHSSLKWGLRISGTMSLRDLGKIVPWLKNVVTSIGRVSPSLNALVSRLGMSEDFYPNAFREPAFLDPAISYIVYGHTHKHEIVPLRAGAGDDEGKVIYVNSGTWRTVEELACYRPKDEEFLGYRVMSYLAFFKGNERKGRSLETWSGALESTGSLY